VSPSYRAIDQFGQVIDERSREAVPGSDVDGKFVVATAETSGRMRVPP
jgi:hypothetical protein